MSQGPTMRVAELVASSTIDLSDLPPEVVRTAKDCIFDTVGVALGGRAQPGGHKIVDFVRAMGGVPGASVYGAGFQTSAFGAALANGTNAAILDYDDNTWICVAHLSGSLATSALALAEARGLSGSAVLEAYIVGFEAACKIGLGMAVGQYMSGRHTTGTLGTMGSTATCAKLLGLDAHTTAVAFGIAASGIGAPRGNFGTMTKGLHTGLAASNAILAATLAADGFTARPDIIETTYGFAHTTVKDDSYQLERIGKGWGDPWNLADPGVGIKFQPSGTMSHCAGQCAVDLALLHDLQPDDVASIACRTTAIGLDIGRYGVPNTAYEAMYSIPWTIAVAITDRKRGLAQFTAERIQDSAVRSLAARVETSVHPDLATVSDLRDAVACELAITLKDGRSYTKFLRRPYGYAGGEPYTDEMLDEKFREVAALSLPLSRVEQAMSLLRHLEDLPDVRELANALRGEVNRGRM